LRECGASARRIGSGARGPSSDGPVERLGRSADVSALEGKQGKALQRTGTCGEGPIPDPASVRVRGTCFDEEELEALGRELETGASLGQRGWSVPALQLDHRQILA